MESEYVDMSASRERETMMSKARLEPREISERMMEMMVERYTALKGMSCFLCILRSANCQPVYKSNHYNGNQYPHAKSK